MPEDSSLILQGLGCTAGVNQDDSIVMGLGAGGEIDGFSMVSSSNDKKQLQQKQLICINTSQESLNGGLLSHSSELQQQRGDDPVDEIYLNQISNGNSKTTTPLVDPRLMRQYKQEEESKDDMH